jgi:hypothetical protein
MAVTIDLVYRTDDALSLVIHVSVVVIIRVVCKEEYSVGLY